VSREITCQQFFDGTTLHGASRIALADDGRVESLSAHDGDCEFPLVSPGYVDVQMNGFDNVHVANASTKELIELDDALFARGTTSWLGTIVTAPLEKMSSSLTSLHQSFLTNQIQGFAGVHIEGPFLGAAPGAHPVKHIIACDLEWISQLVPSVRLVTVAPEQKDVIPAIHELRARNITVSLGHSRPSKSQFEDAVAAGATMVTHLFNGMSGVHHRDPGLAMWALTDDRISCGLIADGVHVQPDALSLAFTAAKSRICLVSDSVSWRTQSGSRPGVEIRDGAPRLSDGTLAGSCTPLSECVQRVVRECGVSLESALASATSIPADLAGLADVGRIRIGQKADILALDSELSILKAWRRLPS
jgi:N-acetylglucosamine-6-phosphate deacetylase